MPSCLTALSVPEYWRDASLTSFGGIPERARILKSTYRFTQSDASRRFTLADNSPVPKSCIRSMKAQTEHLEAIYARFLGREPRLLMALVSEQLLTYTVAKKSSQDLAWHTKQCNHSVVVKLLDVTHSLPDRNYQSVQPQESGGSPRLGISA